MEVIAHLCKYCSDDCDCGYTEIDPYCVGCGLCTIPDDDMWDDFEDDL